MVACAHAVHAARSIQAEAEIIAAAPVVEVVPRPFLRPREVGDLVAQEAAPGQHLLRQLQLAGNAVVVRRNRRVGLRSLPQRRALLQLEAIQREVAWLKEQQLRDVLRDLLRRLPRQAEQQVKGQVKRRKLVRQLVERGERPPAAVGAPQLAQRLVAQRLDADGNAGDAQFAPLLKQLTAKGVGIRFNSGFLQAAQVEV